MRRYLLAVLSHSFPLLIALSACWWLPACSTGNGQELQEEPVPEVVSYNLHIRPVLSENCFACHGPDAGKREAGLRLDNADDAYKALQETPEAHAIVPGKPQASMAFLRLTAADESERMPPPQSNLRLSKRQIQLIEKWISQGARYEPHWAFIPPKKARLPEVQQKDWPRNEIDHFVLSRQETAGLAPNPEAGKEMLLRRLSLDITGLPPSIALMDRFLKDGRKDAYERMIDQLFREKAYGEKMAADWMDVARYADSHGYQDDYYRTQWPWRDWVIHAFNQNMPYDQFITWQLAGDLLPKATKEQILATGFNRNHKITEESGAIDEEYRVMYVLDRTNTVGKALLGLTLECAQCHDHKFDPVTQKEYYQFYAFFNNVAEYGIEELTPGFSRKSPSKMPLMEITREDLGGILSFVKKLDSAALAAPVLANMKAGKNYEVLAAEAGRLKVSVMGDLDTLRRTFVLERGQYDAHGPEVSAGTPKSVLPFSGRYPKNRLGLSQWLFDKKNPLTARVFVNRIWQGLFGVGLVPTAGDFGMQGQMPSHPELLDWLARDFMENGWDIRKLIKKIVTSATYRQSAAATREKLNQDPDNKLLARYPRYRLPAGHIRDLVLKSSGLLVPEIGGPSVKPYQPAGIWEAATSGRGNLTVYQPDTGAALYRRALYTFIKRTVPPPSMILFDASTRDQCEVAPVRTNTPLQALVMMNDPTVLEAAKVLAAKLLRGNTSRQEKIQQAFRLIVGRRADEQETAILEQYYQEQLQLLRQDPPAAGKLLAVGTYPVQAGKDARQWAAFMQVVQMIYNLEETITKS